jgi:hypothetical protein
VKHTKSACGGAGVAGQLSVGRRRMQLQDDGDKRGGMEGGCREGSGRALAMWSWYAVQVDSGRWTAAPPRNGATGRASRSGSLAAGGECPCRSCVLHVLHATEQMNGSSQWMQPRPEPWQRLLLSTFSPLFPSSSSLRAACLFTLFLYHQTRRCPASPQHQRPPSTIQIHCPHSVLVVISASAPALAPAPIHTLHTATTRPP